MLALVNNIQTLLIKIAIIIAVITGLFLIHNWQVNTAVDKAVATQKVEYNKLNQSLQNKSLMFECSIKDDVTTIIKEKDAKIKDVTRKYNDAIASLRQHSTSASTPSNPTADSSNAESTKGVTPKGLLADHAEISLGIARDAEELKYHLNACYQQYNTVKNQLDSYRK